MALVPGRFGELLQRTVDSTLVALGPPPLERFDALPLDPSDRGPGCYAGDPRTANYGHFSIGRTTTLRTWLSMWSLDESQCGGAPHLNRVAVASLVVQSTADRGVFPSDAHAIHDAL